MQFRSIADMSRALHSRLHLVPDDVDLIVGVPRSGMLPASILALALNRRLTDLEGFAAGRWFKSGETRHQLDSGLVRHALIIDDSIRSGGTMRRIRESLDLRTRATFCAVYGAGEAHPEVDFVFEQVPVHRAFEWNVMHHPGILGLACVDIDGILCADPEAHQNDDGPAYRRFLSSPDARFTPTFEIHTIVTSRLEKYRSETVSWLASRGIRYRNLEMLDLPDADTRRKMGCHAKFKASVYRQTATKLFIESEEWQAREIANRAGKPVLSYHGTPHMVYPSPATSRGLIWNAMRIPAALSRRLARSKRSRPYLST